jgi:hypothetical protein
MAGNSTSVLVILTGYTYRRTRCKLNFAFRCNSPCVDSVTDFGGFASVEVQDDGVYQGRGIIGEDLEAILDELDEEEAAPEGKVPA